MILLPPDPTHDPTALKPFFEVLLAVERYTPGGLSQGYQKRGIMRGVLLLLPSPTTDPTASKSFLKFC